MSLYLTEANIAPCGINCSLCLGYQREKKPCPGCLSPGKTKPPHCLACRIKLCEKRQGRPETACPDCPSYPCRRLKDLDKRYRQRYGLSVLGNLTAIAQKGMPAFLASERRRWTCPSCGGLLCMHRPACLACGGPNPHMPAPEKQ